MKNGLFTLSWENIKSALIYGGLMGLLALVNYVSSLDLSAETLLVLGFVASIVKNLLTTSAGNFVGAVKVIPPTE